MRFDHDGEIEIARRSTHRSCIAFARNAHASAVCNASRNAYVNRFVVAHAAFAAARLASRAQFARAPASVAGNVEAHFARCLLNRSAAVASGADLRSPHRSRAVAGLAGIEPGNLNFLYGAAHRIPKIDFEAVFQVGAGFGFFLYCAAAPPTEKAAEEIAKAAAPGTPARSPTEIKTIKIEIYAATCYLLRPGNRREARCRCKSRTDRTSGVFLNRRGRRRLLATV